MSIPNKTEWTLIFSFFGITIGYVPSHKSYYINHWRIRPVFPLSVLLLWFSSIILAEKLLVSSYILKIIMEAVMFMGVCSYISIIFQGPCFIPYYYPHTASSYESIPYDHLSGIITTSEQRDFVADSHLPNFCDYFNCVSRIVLYPDHYCQWAESFIGLRNHKAFVLFLIYSTTYTLMLFLSSLFRLIHSKTTIAILTLAFVSLVFLTFCLIQLIDAISGIRKKTLKTQRLLNRKSGKLNSFNLVFGSNLLTAPVPVSPYHSLNDIQLFELMVQLS